MVLRAIFGLLVLLILAVIGGGGWLLLRPAPPPPPAVQAAPPPPPKKVLVTARAILRGSMLKPEDIASKDVPAEETEGLIVVESPETLRSLAGSMAKSVMPAGTAIRPADIMRPGDHGFMAAVLTPNMRAVTIGVDATSGAAGLVWPGDRVDLILTQTSNDPNLPPGQRISAETVLTNVRVIAIDQQLTQGAVAASPDTPIRTVTLEVGPEDVQRVSVAMRLGRLSLSVRATNGTEDDGKGGSVYARDVSAAFGSDARPAQKPPDHTISVRTQTLRGT